MTKIKKYSGEWFRSTDLWVMSPARFLCATPLSADSLLHQPLYKLQYIQNMLPCQQYQLSNVTIDGSRWDSERVGHAYDNEKKYCMKVMSTEQSHSMVAEATMEGRQPKKVCTRIFMIFNLLRIDIEKQMLYYRNLYKELRILKRIVNSHY